MLASLAIAASLAAMAQADFKADVSSAISVDNVLYSTMTGWNSNSGIFAALEIQGYVPTVSSAMLVLSKDSSSISSSDVDPSQIQSLGSSLVNILDFLTSKAGELDSAGVSSIVKNDIEGVATPAADLMDAIVNVVKGDCSKVDSLTSIFSEVDSALGQAASAFSFSAPSLPQPTC